MTEAGEWVKVDEKEPTWLTVEELQRKSLPMDRRCIVCLERAYSIWIGYDSRKQVGCPSGHTDRFKCNEFAMPNAINRTNIRACLAKDAELRKNKI